MVIILYASNPIYNFLSHPFAKKNHREWARERTKERKSETHSARSVFWLINIVSSQLYQLSCSTSLSPSLSLSFSLSLALTHSLSLFFSLSLFLSISLSLFISLSLSLSLNLSLSLSLCPSLTIYSLFLKENLLTLVPTFPKACWRKLSCRFFFLPIWWKSPSEQVRRSWGRSALPSAAGTE